MSEIPLYTSVVLWKRDGLGALFVASPVGEGHDYLHSDNSGFTGVPHPYENAHPPRTPLGP